jgi:ribonuclease P protein component
VDNRFPAECRLKNRKDIQAVYARRDIFRGERLVFYRGGFSVTVASDSGAKSPKSISSENMSRFCLSVSKACGGAVRRNRIKRILREIIRHHRLRIEPGFDYIIRVNPARLKDKISEKDFLADFSRYFRWS